MDKEEFLKKYVFGWIKNDLKRMTREIPSRRGEVGNINFPLTLCTLSYLEFLGGFLLGRDARFKENVENYINDCFDNPREYSVKLLRDIFRNGLAHDYFARGGISREGSRPPVFKNEENIPILDIETLISDFLKSLDNFKIKLKENNYQKRIYELDVKVEKWQSEHESEINNLPSKCSTSTSIDVTSQAGGYSGYNPNCISGPPDCQ